MSEDTYLDKLYLLIHQTTNTLTRLVKIKDFPNNSYDEKLVQQEIELTRAKKTLLIGLKNEYINYAYSKK